MSAAMTAEPIALDARALAMGRALMLADAAVAERGLDPVSAWVSIRMDPLGSGSMHVEYGRERYEPGRRGANGLVVVLDPTGPAVQKVLITQ